MICKTNIVLLTDCLGDITGGAEKQIFELAQRLPKDQYNVFVASMEATGKTSGSLIGSIGCRFQAFRVIRIYGLSGFIQGLKFYSFLRQNSIDVLVTYHFGSDIWGTFWGHLAGVRTILSNRRDMGFWRGQQHIMAYRLINQWVNKIITVASCVKQMAVETEHVPARKLEVIYNGVDLPEGPVDILQKKKELGLNPTDIVVMHVANLRPVKGHKYLIEAFAKACGQFNNTRLVLIGKDELNGELQDLAQNLGIKNRILFLGQRTDIPQLLSMADICVLPSLSEGMSNAILEYMAAAKPVIATKVGGNPELVKDGWNGFLVEKENVEELKEALLKLIQDKETRQIMGQNGFSRVKTEFSMETMVEHYECMFRKKIKILHLVSSGGFFGAERVILNLASQQNNGEVISWVGAINNKHNPHLEIIQEAQNAGLKTALFDSRSQADLKTVFSIKDFLKENNIDILHTHNYKSDITGFLATRLTPVQWVATMHGWISTDTKLRWYESLDRFVLKFAGKVICVSQNNYDKLLNKGINSGSLAVIDNGIDLEQFSSPGLDQNLKKSLGIGPHENVIAIVGRLGEEKGHKVLFKALTSITPRYQGIKCLVVGDGPLMMDLKEQVKTLNLSPYIIFTGNRKDVAEIYKICDILVNASFTEGLPMTVLEAMASKLPVIATKVGAVPRVIRNEENGLLLEPGDPDTLSLAIISLLNDVNKRNALAQQAFKDAGEHYSQHQMADKYKTLYQELVQ